MGSILSILRWRPWFLQAYDSRQNLLDSLKGRSVEIPDLQRLFREWPQAVNPEVGRLEDDVNQKLKTIFPEGKRLEKMKAADAALFGASWWPYADFETLRIATYLSIWLFAWDDETDSCEFSTLCMDIVKATEFRSETMNYIYKSLGTSYDPKCVETPSSAIISMFGEIGESIWQSSSPAQVQIFLKELSFFINMTDVEQRCQLSGKLPTVEEYQKRRMGSSAVGVCLAITEYCYGMEIPTSVMHEEEMNVLWDETNIIISTANDILSIKKEIAQQQVDTLIPLLTERHGSVQTAIDLAFELIRSSVKSFDEASQKMLARHSDDKILLHKLEKFIEGCQYACTGNLNWSLTSGRYKLGVKSTQDGLRIEL